MIYGEDKIDSKVISGYIEFVPDQEPYFRLKQQLIDFWGRLGNSDLSSIIGKWRKQLTIDINELWMITIEQKPLGYLK